MDAYCTPPDAVAQRPVICDSASGVSVRLSAEGAATAKFDLNWTCGSLGLPDMSGMPTRRVRYSRPERPVLCPVSWTAASGQLALCPVKGYNGSILWGLLFKPHGQLKLTLLAIFIDIATL